MKNSDEMRTLVPKKTPKRGYGGRSAEQLTQERYDRLMSSALELFGTEGYLPTTVEKLCRHAKVTTRHFYEHFADREAILIAIFEQILQQTKQVVLQEIINPELALEQRLLAGIRAFLQQHLQDVRRLKITTQEVLGVSQRVEVVRHAVISEFAALIEQYLAVLVAAQKIPPRNYKVLAFGLVGAMHELQIAWLHQQVPQTVESLVADMDFLIQAMLVGVATSS